MAGIGIVGGLLKCLLKPPTIMYWHEFQILIQQKYYRCHNLSVSFFFSFSKKHHTRQFVIFRNQIKQK